MTINQLHNYLINSSPFKFKGDSKELYSFDKEGYSIDDGVKHPYKLSKKGDNFIFDDKGLFPMFQNVKITTVDPENLTVIINYNPEHLKNYSFRNKDAENGYLILQPQKQTK